MEVVLYNSNVCRLCGEENDNGTLLYLSEENSQDLSEVINTYLPIKVTDDGQLPRTICPGCTIQLEATVEFLTLIINGQKVIRELHLREREYKRTLLNPTSEQEIVTDKIIYEVNTSNGVYQVEHPIALQVAGLEKPKRKRGRPPKKPKSPEELAKELAAKEQEVKNSKIKDKDEEPSGKRRRKTPTRFKEAVQGKELERIFKEEGVTDGEDSEPEMKLEQPMEIKPPVPKEPEVIGHLEESGELVVVVKGKGRGRPKGPMRPTRKECAICGMEFTCTGRYMSHVAQHGPVMYQCGQCSETFTTRLHFNNHQKEQEHTGQNIIPCKKNLDRIRAKKNKTNTETIIIPDEPLQNKTESPPVQIIENVILPIADSLPDLNPEPIVVEDTVSGAEFLKTEGATIDITSSPSVDCEKIVETTPEAIVTEKSDEVEQVEASPSGKPRLKCNHCDKTFSSKQSKSLHIKAAHVGERPYACGECGARFAYPRSLAVHAVSHRRHRAANAKGFACDLCGKVLNHPSSVVYHKEAEHAGQRYVCNKCGKCFKHKQLLQRHQLVHSQDRPYSCKVCSASFKTKANLLNHSLLHTGVKKFSCEICKHKFAHKTSLTLHMRWHTGQKPYSCTTCGKSFSQKGNLSEHERIHTGEKPFACTICPRRFTTSSQHRLHARRHNTDKPFTCAHCGKRFVSRGSWAAHVRRWPHGARTVPSPTVLYVYNSSMSSVGSCRAARGRRTCVAGRTVPALSQARLCYMFVSRGSWAAHVRRWPHGARTVPSPTVLYVYNSSMSSVGSCRAARGRRTCVAGRTVPALSQARLCYMFVSRGSWAAHVRRWPHGARTVPSPTVLYVYNSSMSSVGSCRAARGRRTCVAGRTVPALSQARLCYMFVSRGSWAAHVRRWPHGARTVPSPTVLYVYNSSMSSVGSCRAARGRRTCVAGRTVPALSQARLCYMFVSRGSWAAHVRRWPHGARTVPSPTVLYVYNSSMSSVGSCRAARGRRTCVAGRTVPALSQARLCYMFVSRGSWAAHVRRWPHGARTVPSPTVLYVYNSSMSSVGSCRAARGRRTCVAGRTVPALSQARLCYMFVSRGSWAAHVRRWPHGARTVPSPTVLYVYNSSMSSVGSCRAARGRRTCVAGRTVPALSQARLCYMFVSRGSWAAHVRRWPHGARTVPSPTVLYVYNSSMSSVGSCRAARGRRTCVAGRTVPALSQARLCYMFVSRGSWAAHVRRWPHGARTVPSPTVLYVYNSSMSSVGSCRAARGRRTCVAGRTVPALSQARLCYMFVSRGSWAAHVRRWPHGARTVPSPTVLYVYNSSMSSVGSCRAARGRRTCVAGRTVPALSQARLCYMFVSRGSWAAHVRRWPHGARTVPSPTVLYVYNSSMSSVGSCRAARGRRTCVAGRTVPALSQARLCYMFVSRGSWAAHVRRWPHGARTVPSPTVLYVYNSSMSSVGSCRAARGRRTCVAGRTVPALSQARLCYMFVSRGSWAAHVRRWPHGARTVPSPTVLYVYNSSMSSVGSCRAARGRRTCVAGRTVPALSQARLCYMFVSRGSWAAHVRRWPHGARTVPSPTVLYVYNSSMSSVGSCRAARGRRTCVAGRTVPALSQARLCYMFVSRGSWAAHVRRWPHGARTVPSPTVLYVYNSSMSSVGSCRAARGRRTCVAGRTVPALSQARLCYMFVSRGSWAAHVRRWPHGARTVPSPTVLYVYNSSMSSPDSVTGSKHKKQVHKQVSLLANANLQADPLKIEQVDSPQIQLEAEQTISLPEPPSPVKLLEETPDDELEERVIYVTYDVDEADSPAFHILDPEQAAGLQDSKMLTTCELYSGPSLLVPQPQYEQLELEQEPLQHEELEQLPEELVLEGHDQNIPVTDEQGNPLHFTMQDGTRLAITSADGKSLQVITQDGQTIPVEINGYADEEEVDNPDTIVHQLNLQKSIDSNVSSPVTHYFTIV
uniref:Uncharacterized protein n=2 Tax=Noctuidae TaxID=7100 RepID=A0A2A4JHE2_HELVI